MIRVIIVMFTGGGLVVSLAVIAAAASEALLWLVAVLGGIGLGVLFIGTLIYSCEIEWNDGENIKEYRRMIEQGKDPRLGDYIYTAPYFSWMLNAVSRNLKRIQDKREIKRIISDSAKAQRKQ